jgi:hypothetical protein
MSSQPPDAVQTAALAAFGGQPRQALVAGLTGDEPLEGAGCRLSRRLTFSAPGFDIVVDVRWANDAYAASVAVAPFRPFEITVFTADPSPHALNEAEPSRAGIGSVTIDSVPAGSCMLRLVAADAAVETEWVTLPHPDATR